MTTNHSNHNSINQSNLIETDNIDAVKVPVNVDTGFDWQMLLVVAVIIIFIRESSVWLMTLIGYENLGNLVGLFILLGFALAYRHFKGDIPDRIIVANSRILRESIFAFLPICAGVGILLTQLGNDTFKIVLIMFISTLIPLWLYAYLVKKWL
ncbi:MAG TPA: hypothetical protein VIH30_05235 [Aquirhabdus sp.]